MSELIGPPENVVSSPCIGLCALDSAGYCRGCWRTGDEIGSWMRMSDSERRRLMEQVLPVRASDATPFAAQLAGRERLQQALLPLANAPAGTGWNREELEDLLPPGPPVEAAVLAGLVPRASGTHVLLTRRTEALRNHGGQVGFPGGRVERSDRNPLAAALRESDEEIALPSSQVLALGYLDPFITITGFRVTPIVAVVDPAFVARPEPGEVAEVFEVPLDYLMNPDNLRLVEMEHRGRIRHVMEYAWPGHRIWGATAAILYNLRRRLELLG
ncbi:CoA pyrophosphatase [Stenotrophomonas sp. Iso1]|uniref:CoA pyrophosphatase n=1 Tax=Stenotrophomonas sp. Iso1 TaxID=2977283 RepID=UPI0022B7B326|nr:CoA pyrophosphatase [Stenotrophomonas sp. Iso1]